MFYVVFLSKMKHLGMVKCEDRREFAGTSENQHVYAEGIELLSCHVSPHADQHTWAVPCRGEIPKACCSRAAW